MRCKRDAIAYWITASNENSRTPVDTVSHEFREPPFLCKLDKHIVYSGQVAAALSCPSHCGPAHRQQGSSASPIFSIELFQGLQSLTDFFKLTGLGPARCTHAYTKSAYACKNRCNNMACGMPEQHAATKAPSRYAMLSPCCNLYLSCCWFPSCPSRAPSH